MNRRNFVKTVALGSAAAGSWTARSFAAVPGANSRLRIGVIGCGGMANSHMRALLSTKEADNIDIVAVCDVYQKRLDAAAALTGGRPIRNYKELLEQRDVDYVLIATPEHWHYQMAVDALDAGKHVYLEKPMTQTIDQAARLAKKVKASNLQLQVGVQGMSDESYEVANRYIREGALGKVVMAQIDYSRNYKDDFWAYDIDPDAKPGVNLDWEAWLGPAPKRPWDARRFFQWRRYWDYSGGIASDLFIHRVTRIIRAVGLTFPERVVATGGTWNFTDSVAEIPDTFNILADYPGGPTVALISSMANDTPISHVIRGHKATIEFTREGFTITPQEVLREDRVGRDELRADTICQQVYRKKGAENVTLHHRNLHHAIRQGEELKCDAMIGYYGVVVTSMGVQSFREQAYLRWDPRRERSYEA